MCKKANFLYITLCIFCCIFLTLSCNHEKKTPNNPSDNPQADDPQNDNPPAPHEHTYSTYWQYDSEYHWHPATCGHNVVSEKAEHNFAADGFVCETCGYIKKEQLLDGLFSIDSEGSYAQFSRGNLYSTVRHGTVFDFENHQYDFRTKCLNATDYDKETGKPIAVIDGQPTLTDLSDRGCFTSTELKTGFMLNNISSELAVLSENEWNYILHSRTNAETKWALGQIKTSTEDDADYYVKGLILLPDSYPEDQAFTSGNGNGYSTNEFNIAEWDRMEKLGAVFIATAAYCKPNNDSVFDNYGKYFASDSSSENSNSLKLLIFSYRDVDFDAFTDNYAYPVRLVKRHIHAYSDQWSNDSTHHWHPAICGCSELVKDKDEHDFAEGWIIDSAATEQQPGSKYRECSICHYREDEEIPIAEHNHTFANTYTCDATYHWFPATCGHDVVAQRAKHSFNIDKICSVCKYNQIADNLSSVSLSGEFSVDSEGTKVKFSKGNLYYNGTSWDFEENQFDFRTWKNNYSVINGRMTLTPTTNVGLFYWTNKAEKSYIRNYDNSEESTEDVLFANDNAENWISLTKEQWNYLLGSSAERKDKWGLGAVKTDFDVIVFGLFLLPDNWTNPEDLPTFIPCNLNTAYNEYEFEQWSSMQQAGAVFLPLTGIRDADTDYVSDMGCYNLVTADRYEAIRVWYGVSGRYNTATPAENFDETSSKFAYCLKIGFSMSSPADQYSTYAKVEINGRHHGANAVRLARVVE